MIEIDGSLGEGGGQILRSSLALAAVLNKEVRVFNIRAGRSEPGLKPQHLTGAKAVAELCQASVNGLELNSTEFVFKPGRLRDGDFRFEVGTAGSITLVLQALMPLLPFAPGRISIEVIGGTDVKWSPPIDYVRMVALPLLRRMGLNVEIQVLKRGHYPKGGGQLRAFSESSKKLSLLKGQTIGRLQRIRGVSHVTNLPNHVADRQRASAMETIAANNLPRPEIDVEVSRNNGHLGPGSGLVLQADSENSAVLGGDCLGEKGLPAEDVGAQASQTLIEEIRSGCFLDRHMGDMVVPFLALAEGSSDVTVSQVTQHTLTNVDVAEAIAGVQFDAVGELGNPGRLRVNGLSLENSAANASSTRLRPIADSSPRGPGGRVSPSHHLQ